MLDKAENPDTGGNVHDYERWVVDGFYKDYGVKVGKVLVDMCWNKDNGHDGRGTVRVVVVDDTYGPLDTSIVLKNTWTLKHMRGTDTVRRLVVL